jgi:hypothetical protein
MGVQFQPIAESARDLADAVSEFPDLFARAARLADRVAAGRFHVAVLGEFKRGKSTVINALVGYPVLPTGVVPCTAVITEVRSGSGSATVLHLDGTIEPVAVGQIPDFVTETANPENRRGVERVVVAVPGSLLDSGLVIVDTPGVGSAPYTSTTQRRHARRSPMRTARSWSWAPTRRCPATSVSFSRRYRRVVPPSLSW